jgi:hypothetical protein
VPTEAATVPTVRLLVALLAVLAAAPPAFAHGDEPHRMVSEIRSVSPAAVSASVDDEGRLTVRVPDSSVVVVNDGSGKPHVRFAGGAVYVRSPGGAAWRKVASGTSWSWHEHAAHWEGEEPASVREHPSQTRVVRRWKLTGLVGDAPLAITGDIRWAPPTEGGLGWQWLLVPVVAAMLVYVAYLVYDSRRVTREQRRARTAARAR